MNEDDSTVREADEDDLIRAARRLRKDVPPARDLWPGIAEAIRDPGGIEAPGHGPGWQRYFAYAAAVVLLVGGSSGVTWLVLNEMAPQYMAAEPVAERQVVAEQPESLMAQPVSGSFGGTYELGPEFMAARESLAVRLDGKLDSLSPQARAEVERNIAEIRAAIQQINRVLASEPDNALLQELLLAAYREELYTMRRVDGLISTVMNREDI